MRPGSQPSQNSTARRAEAGVAPPHHTGMSATGLRLEVHVREVVLLAVMLDAGTGPELPRDGHLLLHQLRPVDAAHADDIELVLEVARANAKVEATAGEPGHGGDAVGQVERVPEGDDGGRPEADAARGAGQERERDERLEEGPVGAFHAVGVEDEVVAHPQRVEAQLLGKAGAFDEQVLVGVLAEVGQQQPEARHGVFPSLTAAPGLLALAVGRAWLAAGCVAAAA